MASIPPSPHILLLLLLLLSLAPPHCFAALQAPLVTTGAQRLFLSNFSQLSGKRIAVLSNPSAVLPDLTHIVDAMWRSGAVSIAAVLGPEHGFRGDHQDGQGSDFFYDNKTGLPVYSTYGVTGTQLQQLLLKTGANTILYDIQDVGTRFYTFIWSLWDVMCVAASAGITEIIVLDRPNPIGGRVRGPILQQHFASEIGRLPITLTHGMTVGELARMFHDVWLQPQQRVKITVIACEGWTRSMLYDATGLPWVPLSPNMPTLTTAFLYPGLGLLEGTSMSEGRGTCTPFQSVGAPWLTWRFAEAMSRAGLPCASFRESYFIPTFGKWQGNITAGVFANVDDASCIDSLPIGISVIAVALQQAPHNFAFLDDDFDIHMGTNATRLALLRASSPADIVATWLHDEQAFEMQREPFLLYPS